MADKRLVWDLPLRAFHWLLVLSILGLYLTGKAGFEWMPYHFYLGYTVIGLLLFRIIWGFIGPKHARFGGFLPGPGKLFGYLGKILKADSTPSIGHNPAGAVMVVVILVLVGLQAFSGLFTTDDIAWAGPYNPAVSTALASKLTSLHHINFNILATVIWLHIAAILFYRFYKKQDLVTPMVNGYKPASLVPAHEAIRGSELIKALIVALVCAGAVYWLVHSAPPPAAIDY
jgi:cytochrome b